MKRRRAHHLLFLAALLVLAPGFAGAEVKVAPYYSLQFTEGAAVPTKGDWMFAINLASDLGIILQPSETQRFIGFYELKYNGPGLRRQEGEKFTDRDMDHIVILRHHYRFAESYTLKSQLDYMTEYKRTGTNELWGSGLYDFNRSGGTLTLERKFSPAFSAAVSGQYHLMEFPNYTDLLAEFQSAGESAESSTGKQNHNLYLTGLTLTYGNSRVSADYLLMAYAKQQVVTETVQPDKTYYSDTLQRDTVLSLALEHSRRLGKRLWYRRRARCA
jgi:hypothetical protein